MPIFHSRVEHSETISTASHTMGSTAAHTHTHTFLMSYAPALAHHVYMEIGFFCVCLPFALLLRCSNWRVCVSSFQISSPFALRMRFSIATAVHTFLFSFVLDSAHFCVHAPHDSKQPEKNALRHSVLPFRLASISSRSDRRSVSPYFAHNKRNVHTCTCNCAPRSGCRSRHSPWLK